MRILIIFLTLLSLLIIHNSKVYSANLEEAIILYQKGNFKKCIKYLEDYIKMSPDPRAYYLLGYSYYKIKKHTEAMKYFKEVYLIDPEFSPAKSIWKANLTSK